MFNSINWFRRQLADSIPPRSAGSEGCDVEVDCTEHDYQIGGGWEDWRKEGDKGGRNERLGFR